MEKLIHEMKHIGANHLILHQAMMAYRLSRWRRSAEMHGFPMSGRFGLRSDICLWPCKHVQGNKTQVHTTITPQLFITAQYRRSFSSPSSATIYSLSGVGRSEAAV